MFFFSTDIDGTIYDGPESAAAFSNYWSELCSRDSERPVLAYNTGRSLDDTRDLVRKAGLPEPDWFICGVGTTIYDPVRGGNSQRWFDLLSEGWDFERVRETVSERTPARPQPPECQSTHKCSWFWENAEPRQIAELEAHIRGLGINAQAVYSSRRDLDILPAKANKGNAVRFLAREIGIPMTRVIVAGDSGNDASMYGVEDVRGVVVSNAEPALVQALHGLAPFHATQPCALGVIEGIDHWQRAAQLEPSSDR